LQVDAIVLVTRRNCSLIFEDWR